MKYTQQSVLKKETFENIQYNRACNLAAAFKNTEKSDAYRMKAFYLYLIMEKRIFKLIRIYNNSIPKYYQSK